MKEDKNQKPKIKYADDTTPIPATLEKSIKIDDITFMAPRGSKQTDLVFVSACPLEEEAEEGFSPPFLLKGPVGTLIQRSVLKCGIDIEKCWYTTLIKHCLPRKQKLKPTSTQIFANKHLIAAELKEIKPKLIVCFGKSAFDYFCNFRLKMNEAIGGIFHSKEYNCMIYCMDDAVKLLYKPELLERFYVDLKEIKKTIDALNGTSIDKVPLNYRTINSKKALEEWLQEIKDEKIFSVDCEWGGKNFIDGQLRYTQFAWKPGHAVCLQFYNCKQEYMFDISFEEIGKILSPLMNNPDTKFIGHNICADAVWLDRWLNIDIYKRVIFDTMYAMHTVDEASDMKLERLAVKWTDLGRYDIDLIVWKKENGVSVDEGYERVPDEILIPYSCLRKDSLVQLGDGSWEKIQNLVNKKYTGTVRCLVNGKIVNRYVTNWHKQNTKQKEWYKLVTKTTIKDKWGGFKGPVLTADHKIVTQRGKVRVDELILGKDKIATSYTEPSSGQLSIILGSLLGDGGLTSRNGVGVGLHFGQTIVRTAYAEWKHDCLNDLSDFKKVINNSRVIFSSQHSPSFKFIKDNYSFKPITEHARRKLRITQQVLDNLGLLGLAVWYQDDGTFTKDNSARITCKYLDESEQVLIINYLTNLFGEGISYYNKCSNHFINFNIEASKRFLSIIAEYMHPVFAYKTTQQLQIPIIEKSNSIFYETIDNIVKVENNRRGHTIRYCLSVEEAENFVTTVGVVSNCKDVDATLRCVPILMKLLIEDNTYDYYMTIKLPFVTDGFFDIVKTGLPVDLTDIDSQRNTFIFVRDKMEEIFMDKLEEEAKVLLFTKLATILDFMVAAEVYNKVIEALPSARASIIDIVKIAVKRDYPKIIHTIEHLVNCRNFNHRSSDKLKQYLYVVKGYIPIKTTKHEGMPAVNWEKILALPPEQQKEYNPSTDGDTLQVFADQGDELLQFLISSKNVATITRTFLRPQDEEGNEEGLIGHVCSDGRIHSTLYLTDTNRPRLTFLFLKMICISKIKVDIKEYMTNILLCQRTINYSLKSVSVAIKNLKHLMCINTVQNAPLSEIMEDLGITVISYQKIVNVVVLHFLIK